MFPQFRGAAIIVLTASLLGCGPSRIKKLPVPQENRIEAYRLMGEADGMMNEGKDHLAVLKYLEATTLNPYHEAIFNKLAIAYCRTGRYWQGQKAAKRSIGLDPDYAPGYNTLGIAALSNRRYKQAVGYFEKAIGLDRRPSYYVNLGYGQMMRGRYEESRQAYLRASQLDPNVFKKTSVARLRYPDPL
jgi:tetratricopeptide (TPR) repeat protein